VSAIQLNVFKDSFPGGFLIIRVGLLSSITAGLKPASGHSSCAPHSEDPERENTTDHSGTLARTAADVDLWLILSGRIRIRPNLTINLGIRYEPIPCPTKSKAELVRSLRFTSHSRRPQLPFAGSSSQMQAAMSTCNANPGHLSGTTPRGLLARVGFASVLRIRQGVNGKNVHSRKARGFTTTSSPCLIWGSTTTDRFRFYFWWKQQSGSRFIWWGRYIFRFPPDATYRNQILSRLDIGACQSAHQADRLSLIDRAPKLAYVISTTSACNVK